MTREFENILNQLEEKEKKQAINSKIDTPEKLIPLLLRRVSTNNVDQVISLLKKSIIPSICSEIDTHLEHLFSQIEQSPQLLFRKDFQDKIEHFIFKRFERDKKIVIEKTSDISKFVVLMGEYLNEAITKNGLDSKTIIEIKEKISSMDLNKDGIDALSFLQKELILAASLIEDEMNSVNNRLQSGKTKVEELEEKIKELENELKKSKIENMKDHITGLLTRKAYENEIKKVETSFIRNELNYAVVFFDLDFFKKINDNYGHKCGDTILMTFGKILSKNTREFDIVGRYGGEEFISIVHFNFEKELLQYLRRIKTIVTQNSFLYDTKKIKVTFSAGVAIRKNYTSYEETIKNADKLLYEAKNSGRNKLIIDNQTII